MYKSSGRTLRYSYTGELRFGEKDPIVLKALNRDLGGIELISDERFYDLETWGEGLFCKLGYEGEGLSCDLETKGEGLFYNQ